MRLRVLALLLFSSLPALAQAGVDVRVHGLDREETENAYAQIGLLDYSKKVDAAKSQYDTAEVQRLFAQGGQDIRNALQPFGWYNPVIASQLQGAAPHWKATYTVDPGPPTDITQIDIQITGVGKDDAALLKVLQKPRLSLGTRLRHVAYENLKTRLQQAALSSGYLDANFTRHELRVDVSNNTAQILLTLETGPRYYFGTVTIQQDGSLDDRFLRHYLTMKPGEPFDASKVLSTQFNFNDLGYFQSVDIDTQKDKAGPDRRIPLIIRTSPKKLHAYKLGGGYGTDTGFRALAGVEFRQLNQDGHKLRIELRPSQNISTAIIQYSIPVGDHPGDAISFTNQALRQNFQGINETLYSSSAAYERQLGLWSRRLYLTYTNDNFTLPSETPQTSVLLTPGFTVSRTDLNDPIYPRRGWFISLDIHGGSKSVVSDTNFIEGLFQLRGVYPLARGLRVLAHFQEGATIASQFQTLPPSQRFFAGGDESVRGYSYQSLGPHDAYGNVVGGKYLTTGSLELDYDVYKNYGVAVFTDVGGADNVPNVLLHYGVGIGFRYRAPFGAIAIDLAHPFDYGSPPVRLDIGMRVGL